ncbi:MAG TPA: Rrf2 family transcriptional regulator, partial [Burkholderiaceae bacterium]|nr:Rrf2 family transcriptional regulator [Burkholderiaceae bacterium]
MNLQKNSSLALYSVIEIAAAGGRHVPAAEIAAKYAVSAHHLAKVLSELARAGIVESVRGVGGGYRFVGNAKRLTLLDVISLFEDISSPPGRPPGESTPVASALETISA